jgi:hypothetical protein
MNACKVRTLQIFSSKALAHGDSPVTVDITDHLAKCNFVGSKTWFLSATLASGSGNLDAVIQSSHDNGTTKTTCLTFTQLTTTGHELKGETIRVVGQKVYAVFTISSSAHYTVNLWVSGPALVGFTKRVGMVYKQINPHPSAAYYTASTDGNFDITDVFQSVNWVESPTVFLEAVEGTNGSTLDVDINVSLDCVNYEEVVSMTQLSATGTELKAFTIPPWGEKVQLVVTVSSGGGDYGFRLKIAGFAAGAMGV